MNKRIEKLFEINEKGELKDHTKHMREIHEGKVKFLGVEPKTIGFCWECEGKKFIKKYAYPVRPQSVCDGEGILVVENEPYQGAENSLVFYEPDGRERFRIRPPGIVKENVGSTGGRFHYPRFNKRKGVWEVLYNNGECDWCEYLADLDIETGYISNPRKIRY